MITVLGETVVDRFDLGDGEVSYRPGGSPANVAVALARLGETARLATQLGHDPHGRMLLRHLRENAVTVVPGSVGDGYSTSVARTVLTQGHASYDFSVAWEPLASATRAALLGDDTVCLHTGSIAASVEPGAESVLRAVLEAAGRATITFDPNCRPSIMGPPDAVRRRAERLVTASDIVKASDDDIGWLYPDRPLASVVAGWLDLGAELVVVTLGRRGSRATTRGLEVAVPAEHIDVVDTVGAGDSFMAGLLSGLRVEGLLGAAQRPRLRRLGEDTVARLLHMATRVAALTCARRGAHSPTAREVAAARPEH